jgi:hypothetical protein
LAGGELVSGPAASVPSGMSSLLAPCELSPEALMSGLPAAVGENVLDVGSLLVVPVSPVSAMSLSLRVLQPPTHDFDFY